MDEIQQKLWDFGFHKSAVHSLASLAFGIKLLNGAWTQEEVDKRLESWSPPTYRNLNQIRELNEKQMEDLAYTLFDLGFTVGEATLFTEHLRVLISHAIFFIRIQAGQQKHNVITTH